MTLTPEILGLLNQSNRVLGIPALPSALVPPPLPTLPTNPPRMPKPGSGYDGAGPVAVIANNARKFGLDPAAVLAYALEESGAKYGAIGDKGTSFGPFQAHIGGAAGQRTPQQASAWANSPQGLVQMMRMMAQSGARGLTGEAAVRAIYAGFGKGTPTAVPKGVARYQEAVRALGQLQNAPTVVVDHNDRISPLAAPIIKLAGQYLGTPYKWGGASPATGFDCSGFVQWLYAQKGIRIPRTTFGQIKAGRQVVGPLKPGDAVFFNTENDPRGPSHEGLYIGHGQFIQSPHTGDVVKISSLNDPYYRAKYVGARRFV